MSKLNADGTPRKKYVSNKMRLAESRRKAQKKAWETRRALYPETNGFKSTMVQDDKEPENGKILTEEKSGVADMLRKTVFELEELVKDLNQHNSLLTGELRGANFCFQKLVEEMTKGKEGV